MGLNHESENAVPPERRREEVLTVVVNHEGLHPIWASRRPLPAGWTEADTHGDREACLASKPGPTCARSLRRRMEAGIPEVPSRRLVVARAVVIRRISFMCSP